MIEKLGHYSLTTPCSVYDEEALTALELAGRTAGKVNECIDEFNRVEGTIDKSVEKCVETHIQKGSFDKQIDKHTSAITREVEGLSEDVKELDHRMDNIVNNGSENSAEVLDIRVGADGKTYSSAGGAVREQLRAKVGVDELYPVDYETGSIAITTSGWDYSEEYGKNSRVRTKEGRPLKLYAGDVVGLTSYADARYYLGFRVGDTYTFAGWLTSEYTIEKECECVILVAHATDVNLNTPEDPDILGSLIYVKKMDGTASKARHANENIANVLDVDLNMVLGGFNMTSGVYGSRSRFITRDVLRLGFDIVLKRSEGCRMAVFTYSDLLGDNARDLGWVTDGGDYTVKAGTCFRVMVMPKDYDVEATVDINPLTFFESELYNAIVIEPLTGRGINLMKTARTLARLEGFKARIRRKREVKARKIRSINHRGYNYEAPENTLGAFRRSKENGFDFVECDVRFTKGGNTPVLFHDDTVDRITDGTGRVCDKTLEQLKALNFTVPNPDGDSICLFEEFLDLCHKLALHPYIEIEPDGDDPITMEQAEILFDLVKIYNMESNVTWISFRVEDLQKIVSIDPFARVGLLLTEQDTSVTKACQNLTSIQTGMNDAFFNVAHTNSNLDNLCGKAIEMGVDVEVWTVDDENYITGVSPYVNGITSDVVVADRLIRFANDANTGHSDLETTEFYFRKKMTWAEFLASEYYLEMKRKGWDIHPYKDEATWLVYVREWGYVVDGDLNRVEMFDEIKDEEYYSVY